jgi:ribosomal protein S18 acetylase RimI-like enzyme
LLRVCEDRIDLPAIKLSVRASNQAAIILYRNYGYQRVEIWSAYYQDGEDAVVMEKSA